MANDSFSCPDPSSGRPRRLELHLHRDDPEQTVLCLRGELDRCTAPLLAVCLDELLVDATHRTTVVINLAATSFVDIGGVNTLLEAHRRACARGATVRLASCSRQLLRSLEATGVVRWVEVISGIQPGCDAGACASADTGTTPGRTAHTDLPSANSLTPHRIDSIDTTCNPRPRRAFMSKGRGRGGGQG